MKLGPAGEICFSYVLSHDFINSFDHAPGCHQSCFIRLSWNNSVNIVFVRKIYRRQLRYKRLQCENIRKMFAFGSKWSLNKLFSGNSDKISVLYAFPITACVHYNCVKLCSPTTMLVLIRAGNSLIWFPSVSLVCCPKMSDWANC